MEEVMKKNAIYDIATCIICRMIWLFGYSKHTAYFAYIISVWQNVQNVSKV